MAADANYRENAARAVWVTGEVSEAQVHRLTPEIGRLRGQGNAPITVYLNSRGGSTLYAEQLRALLKTTDQDGRVCRMVTVATNVAASAAADLLALGDYAIAYPQAIIHYHGTRLSANDVTRERAESLAASLKETNEDFALNLARRTFGRMAFHFANLRGDFAALRRREKKAGGSRFKTELECFAALLFGRLSPRMQELPSAAYQQHMKLLEMSDFVWSEGDIFASTDPRILMEAAILKRLVDFKLSIRRPDEVGVLTDGGLEEIATAFLGFCDFIAGPHRQGLEDQIAQFGPLFLDLKEVQDFLTRRETDPKKASAWLAKRVKPVMEPLWYFVVSLCRLLQAGEYSLSATDAYWLGIVDEVVGARRPTLRLIAENTVP